MYQKVLVAYNATQRSTIALQEAADLVRESKGELHVLGIVANTGAIALADTTSGTESILAIEHERFNEALERVRAGLKEQGLNVATNIREGDAANEIIAEAYRIKADLTVIGHSNKGVLARWFQGSVGARLMSELPCSLLIAADGKRG